jgi:hypothetical protein
LACRPAASASRAACGNIWGRITDEFTHPDGDPDEGRGLAEEAARELRNVLGDPERERAYCDRWIYERLDIV